MDRRKSYYMTHGTGIFNLAKNSFDGKNRNKIIYIFIYMIIGIYLYYTTSMLYTYV